MAKLSKAEQAAFEKLQAKLDAPDAPAVGKSISATIDLSDDKQIAAAIKHGFLTADEVEDLKEDDDDGDGKKKASTPRRKSYFKEPDDE